jgi:hypothetical protein
MTDKPHTLCHNCNKYFTTGGYTLHFKKCVVAISSAKPCPSEGAVTSTIRLLVTKMSIGKEFQQSIVATDSQNPQFLEEEAEEENDDILSITITTNHLAATMATRHQYIIIFIIIIHLVDTVLDSFSPHVFLAT